MGCFQLERSHERRWLNGTRFSRCHQVCFEIIKKTFCLSKTKFAFKNVVNSSAFIARFFWLTEWDSCDDDKIQNPVLFYSFSCSNKVFFTLWNYSFVWCLFHNNHNFFRGKNTNNQEQIWFAGGATRDTANDAIWRFTPKDNKMVRMGRMLQPRYRVSLLFSSRQLDRNAAGRGRHQLMVDGGNHPGMIVFMILSVCS